MDTRPMLYEIVDGLLVTTEMVDAHGIPELGRNASGSWAKFPDGHLIMRLSPDATAYPYAPVPWEPYDWRIGQVDPAPPFYDKFTIHKRWK